MAPLVVEPHVVAFVVDDIVRSRFAVGTPRSPAYMLGFRLGCGRAHGARLPPCSFVAGTEAFDAYFAGVDEGRRN